MSVQRFDRGELSPPVQTPEGWLRADAYIARAGILEYKRVDGSVQREYRPPEENAKEDALDSFSMVPLTSGHPSSGLLTADNTKAYQIGTVERPRADGDTMRARVLITDSNSVKSAKAGKVQLSCGYSCDLEFTPGEINGQRYDAIQKNVRGNHVALVWEGRAGPEIRLRVDSADAEIVESSNQADSSEIGTEIATVKVRIDGIEFDVADAAAQAFQKFETQRADESKKAQEAIDREKARADAAESDAKKWKAEADAAPAKVKADLEARSALVAKAKDVLGDALKADASDAEIKKTVAEKVLGLKLDGRSDSYLEASFDLALARHAEESKRSTAYRGTSSFFPTNDAGPDSIAEARRKFHAAVKSPKAAE